MKMTNTRAIKAGLWYTFSNFLSRGLLFITTPIFTRLLTKNEFGEFSNFATWQTLLIVLTTLDLYTTVARAKYDYNDDIDSYLSSITVLGTIVTFFIYMIIIAFMPTFEKLLGMKSTYIHIVFIYLLVEPALQNYQAKCRIFSQYKIAAFLTISSSLLSVLFSLFLVLTIKDKLFGRIFGQEFILIIFNFFIYVYIIIKARGKILKISHCKYALMIAVPLIPHLLAGNLLGAADKLMIKKYCGNEELALYSVAFNCSLLARVFWESLNQAVVPWLYEKIKHGEYSIIKKFNQIYILFFFLCAFIIMLISPEVLLVLGGEKYMMAKFIMPPIIAGCCYQFTYSLYVNIEMYYKKTIMISIGTIAAGITNIILNILLIKIFGYIGAAYATFICYGLLIFFHYQIVNLNGLSYIYDNKFNFILCLLAFISVFLASLIYLNDFLRYAIITIISIISIIIILKNKKKILLLVEKNKK